MASALVADARICGPATGLKGWGLETVLIIDCAPYGLMRMDLNSVERARPALKGGLRSEGPRSRVPRSRKCNAAETQGH